MQKINFFLKEIEDKDEQLQRMERIMIDATKNFDCLTEKYSKLQEEFIKFKEVKERELNRKINDTIAEYEVELEWYNVRFFGRSNKISEVRLGLRFRLGVR